jgi:hypothetical protein
MKKLAILFIAAIIILSSCATSRNGCGTERDVQRHDSRPFRAEAYPNYNRAILVKIQPTFKGNKHFFITDTSDTITRYFNCSLTLNECYLVRKNI